ncbi:uncharacterized protein LOC113503762 [Trichoplusia ni]|uniref:Uncharacterized protein LOC113503762 n=1 Tax=Trichoplusia ni TaxID=7111 RepID=A0A7E5WLL6_TRINI|nr:uncharacterized protein LOC113503762 [Trichoplusia ni]
MSVVRVMTRHQDVLQRTPGKDNSVISMFVVAVVNQLHVPKDTKFWREALSPQLYHCGSTYMMTCKEYVFKYLHVRAANFLCHGCYMRANSEVSRRIITGSNRFDALEDHQPDQNIQIPIPPPPPPQLPPPLAPQLHLGPGQDVSSISLPNYRCCANTSRRCIFNGCQQSAGYLVPTLIKSALLFYNKLYADSNEWELLLENSSLSNTFAALEIEGNHPLLLRARIKSRHTSRREYYTYSLYDELPSFEDQLRNGILSYRCNCVSSNRTVGCCAHILTILWYLVWTRYQEAVFSPAAFYNVLLILNVSTI